MTIECALSSVPEWVYATEIFIRKEQCTCELWWTGEGEQEDQFVEGKADTPERAILAAVAALPPKPEHLKEENGE